MRTYVFLLPFLLPCALVESLRAQMPEHWAAQAPSPAVKSAGAPPLASSPHIVKLRALLSELGDGGFLPPARGGEESEEFLALARATQAVLLARKQPEAPGGGPSPVERYNALIAEATMLGRVRQASLFALGSFRPALLSPQETVGLFVYRNHHQRAAVEALAGKKWGNGGGLYDVALAVQSQEQLDDLKNLISRGLGNATGIYNQALRLSNPHQRQLFFQLLDRRRGNATGLFDLALSVQTASQAHCLLLIDDRGCGNATGGYQRAMEALTPAQATAFERLVESSGCP